MSPGVISLSIFNGEYELLHDLIICKTLAFQWSTQKYFVCIMHGIGMRCYVGRDEFMEHDFVLTKLFYVPFFF